MILPESDVFETYERPITPLIEREREQISQETENLVEKVVELALPKKFMEGESSFTAYHNRSNVSIIKKEQNKDLWTFDLGSFYLEDEKASAIIFKNLILGLKVLAKRENKVIFIKNSDIYLNQIICWLEKNNLWPENAINIQRKMFGVFPERFSKQEAKEIMQNNTKLALLAKKFEGNTKINWEKEANLTISDDLSAQLWMEGEEIGFIIIGEKIFRDDETHFCIGNTRVDENFHKKGIFRYLLGKILEKAHEKSIKTIRSDANCTTEYSRKSHQYFIDLGCSKLLSINNNVGDPVIEIDVEKFISLQNQQKTEK